MTAPLYAIGRFCARHHWATIAAWVVLAVGLVLLGQTGESKTNDNLTLPGTGSTKATELLEDKLPEQAFGSNPLVFQAKAGQALTAPKYASALEESVLSVGPSELTEAQALAVLDAGNPAEAAGAKVSVGAYVGSQLSKPDTGASDAIGIAAAIVILLFAFAFAFGTATAMVLPWSASSPASSSTATRL